MVISRAKDRSDFVKHKRPDFVIWVDPGLVNGYAWYDIRQNSMVMHELSGEACIRMIEAAVSNERMARRTAFGVEKFIITRETPRKSQDALRAIEMIGMMRRAVLWGNNAPFYAFNDFQTSVQVKMFCPDNVLHRVGWYRLGFDHGHDAARHIYYYLAENHWLSEHMVSALFPDDEEDVS